MGNLLASSPVASSPSTLLELFDVLFRKKPCRVLLLGLDGAGKTTILYRMKLDGKRLQTREITATELDTASEVEASASDATADDAATGTSASSPALEAIPVVPTVGFNVETFTYKNMEFTAWDAAGDPRVRSAWRNYIHNIEAVIYVVDAADDARLHEAMEELHRIFECAPLQQAKLLVFANKQDQPGALDAEAMAVKLRLDAVTRNARHVQPASAATGQGLLEGLFWLTKAMRSSSSSAS